MDFAEHAGNGVDVVVGDDLVAVQDVSGVRLCSARSLHSLHHLPYCQLYGTLQVKGLL